MGKHTSAADTNEGLIIVTGPTESGKSTLLAATHEAVTAGCGKRGVTFEEPIEFNLIGSAPMVFLY